MVRLLSLFLALNFLVPSLAVRAEDGFRDQVILEAERRREDRRKDDLLEEIAPKRLNPFNLDAQTRTRFGTYSINRMPNKLEFLNSRVPLFGKYGRNNRYLGLDTRDPGFRFKPKMEQEIPDSPPHSPGSRSDFSGQASTPAQSARSANIPILPDTATLTGQPRSPVGFFERPGMMPGITGSPPNAIAPNGSSTRSSAKDRWFRDIGRNSGPSGTGTRAPRGTMMDTRPGKAGQAFAVGGQDPLAPDSQWTDKENIASQPIPVQMSPTRDQAIQAQKAGLQSNAQRRFEQQLEGMLLTDPSVHFLSPVRVSFQNGVATVRGVVSDKRHQLAAGKVLLSNPSVRQVNNHISVVPMDTSEIPPLVEPSPN